MPRPTLPERPNLDKLIQDVAPNPGPTRAGGIQNPKVYKIGEKPVPLVKRISDDDKDTA